MPFINGKFYVNPAYGHAVERARARENSPEHDQADAPEQGGRWVTIEGRHVFIQETQAGRPHHSTGQTIAAAAERHNGSTNWAFAKRKDNFAPGTNKCNKFVYDVTKEAGAEAIVIGADGKPRPPLAGEWADPRTPIAGWQVLGANDRPQPGDVAAYKLRGGGIYYSGHSGIVTSVDQSGAVHAIAAHEKVVGPDNEFNSSKERTATYRRYTGGQ